MSQGSLTGTGNQAERRQEDVSILWVFETLSKLSGLHIVLGVQLGIT